MTDDIRTTYGPTGPHVRIAGHLSDTGALTLVAICRSAPEHARIDVRDLVGGSDNALRVLAGLERIGVLLIGVSITLRTQIELLAGTPSAPEGPTPLKGHGA